MLTVSTATKQLVHTNPTIGLAELCLKSNIDLRWASPRTCRTRRQAYFKPVDGSSRVLRTADCHQIDPCEKWRLAPFIEEG